MAETPPRSAASKSRPRIAIADKNPMVCQGLKDFIGRDRRFVVVGVFRSGGEFLRFIEGQSILG